jgi:tRNA (guanine37-N1)-methyltransferase
LKFYVATLFPEIFDALDFSILRIAMEKGLVEVVTVNPRGFSVDSHGTVDDAPYGGGAGMVMKPEPLVDAIEWVKAREPEIKGYLLSPQGSVFRQSMAWEFSKRSSVLLVCGRYEGVDDRVRGFLDGEVSLGDFVLAGGELAAMTIIEAVTRLIPGVLGSSQSLDEESFAMGLLEYPQYTRPSEFRGIPVPQVLLSGDHSEVARWRRFQRVKITWEKRPDLLAKARLTEEDKCFLEMVIKGEDPWEES